MKDFYFWLKEASNYGPVFRDSVIKIGDYIEVVEDNANYGRIMARVIDINHGSTNYNKINSIKIQPTDFSDQHGRNISTNIKKPYWIDVPYRKNLETGEDNSPNIWLINPAWIDV